MSDYRMDRGGGEKAFLFSNTKSNMNSSCLDKKGDKINFKN